MTRIITALDTTDTNQIYDLVQALRRYTLFKVGLESYIFHGPEICKYVPIQDTFLDLKFYDIPNTVAGAMRSALSKHKPAIVNVSAWIGLEGMQRAVEIAREHSPTTKVIAVTVLTSMDTAALSQLLNPNSMSENINSQRFALHLARLACQAGCDGVVCSGHEVPSIKGEFGPKFLTVVPGIRPAGSATNDQKRVMTPREAKEAGADYLVIGRPITEATNPVAAAKAILAEMGE